MNRALLALLVLFLGCSSDSETDAVFKFADPGPPKIPVPVDPDLVMRDITAWAGLNNANPGLGLTFIDVDRDGFDDIVSPGKDASIVFRNRGDGSFYSVLKLEHPNELGQMAYALDLTSDGVDDLLIVTNRSYRAYKVSSAGVKLLEDFIPVKSGIGDQSVLTFGDFDRSGFHDLYLGYMGKFGGPGDGSDHGNHGEDHGEDHDDRDQDSDTGNGLEPCHFLHNEPEALPFEPADDAFLLHTGSTFTEITESAGFGAPVLTQALATMDVNDDGILDVLVGTEGFIVDEIYLGNGSGGFVESAAELGVTEITSAMGFDLADVNGDGYQDLYITDEDDVGDKLYLRQSDGRYKVANLADVGLEKTREGTGWGVGFYDWDQDTDIDLFVVNGKPFNDCPAGAQPNFLFLNNGTGVFEYIEAPLQSGLDHIGNSRAAVFGDIENDGDIDVLFSNTHSAPVLLRNEIGTGRWLQLRLKHSQLSPPVGAIARIRVGENVYERRVHGTASYGGSSFSRLHFGLGDAEVVDVITVTWPEGTTQTIGPVDVDQILEIIQAID